MAEQDAGSERPWDRQDFGLWHQRKQNYEVYRHLRAELAGVAGAVAELRAQERELLAARDALETSYSMSSGPCTEQSAPPPAEPVPCFPRMQSSAVPDPQLAPSPAAIALHRADHPKVVLNIGGTRFEVMWRTFEARRLSRLGRLSRAKTDTEILALVDDYSLPRNEFYVDRDPGSFNCILNYFRTGKLHLLDEVCPLDYADDMKFWMINESFMEFCCQDKFLSRREAILGELAKKNEVPEEEEEEYFGEGCFVPYQKALWDLFEKPQGGLAAKVMSLVSVGIVLISLACMCINTFPSVQILDKRDEPADNPRLAMLEAICISFFTVEFLLRLSGSPDKLVFLKVKMNIIDMLAIAPYYITLFFMPAPDLEPLEPGEVLEEEEPSAFGSIGRVMQVFRIARIMRVFKLARRSVGLQSIVYTVKTSYKDLGLLFSLVFMGMLVFGSLLYYAENGEPDTGFYSIPQGMWWGLQTLTSVGYGDFPVLTVAGKLMAAATAVCGVLVMALPIPIVVDNFADYYQEQKKLEAQELKEEAKVEEAMWQAEQNVVLLAALTETVSRTKVIVPTVE